MNEEKVRPDLIQELEKEKENKPLRNRFELATQ